MNIFIPFKKYDGRTNMAIDLALINCAAENDIDFILRLYGWNNPTITVGRNQESERLNTKFCNTNRISFVKRPTGGRALLHDNELTYSFIASANLIHRGDSVIRSYKEISEALIIGFKKLGIKLEYPDNKKMSDKEYCMAISTGADLCYKGKKFIGSAQFRKKDYILQHGSIPFSIDVNLVENIFNSADGLDELITLNQIKQTSAKSLCDNIKFGFEKKFNIKFIDRDIEIGANLSFIKPD